MRSARVISDLVRGPRGVLALVTAILFAETLTGARILYERDIHLWFYGQVETLVRIVAAGSWPVWDPYLAFGQPLVANPGAQVLYPWTWLNFLLEPSTYYTVYIVSHHLLAAAGFYALAGRLGISRPGSLIAATLWAVSGPLLSFVNLWQHFAGAAWIPWVLVAADRALAKPRVDRVLAWGGLVALQVLAGSLEMVLVGAALSTVVLVRRLAPLEGAAARGGRVAAASAAAVFALGLSAALWLPALDLLGASRRQGLEAGIRTFWSLHPASLPQVLWPVVLDDLPLADQAKKLLFDGREPFLASIYVGLSALPLVAAALLARSRLVLALLAVTLPAVVFALGRHTPVYDLALQAVPPLGMFRFPSKLMIVPAFSWALLAGLGFDRWSTLSLRRVRAVSWVSTLGVAVSAAAAIAVAVAPQRLGAWLLAGDASVLWPVGAKLFAAAALAATLALLARAGRLSGAVAVALVAADLLVAHRGLNATIPKQLLLAPPPTLGAIEVRGPTRIFAFAYVSRVIGRELRRPQIRDAFTAAAEPPLSASARTAIGLQEYLAYSAASRWGLYSGYWADSLAIGSQKLYNLDLFLQAVEETPGFLRMLRVGAVSHVIAIHTEGLEELAPVATFASPFKRPIRVYRVPDPLPRVYVVGGARAVDGYPAYQALVDPGFDPTAEIVVPSGSPVWHEASAAAVRAPGRGGVLRALAYGADRIRASVTMDRHGYLAVADAWAPGWVALVDGVEAPVLRANVAFRAVPVPPGEHEVELAYRPPGLRTGLIVSAACALAGLLAAVLAARVRRQPGTQDQPRGGSDAGGS